MTNPDDISEESTETEGRPPIVRLDTWDFPDTASVTDGWDRKSVPLASHRNMEVLIEKLNEVIEVVNGLGRISE